MILRSQVEEMRGLHERRISLNELVRSKTLSYGSLYDTSMTQELPNQQAIDDIHQQYAPSQAAYELVHTHCHIVADITFQLAQTYVAGGHNTHFNTELAVVGAWLHDIGTYQVFAHDGTDNMPLAFDRERYIVHGLLGYRLLLDAGFDESIARFARNHTGVGILKQEVIDENLPLPPADYVPDNDEQELVMYADKFNSKSLPASFIAKSRQDKRAARFGNENLHRWETLVAKYSLPDIDSLASKYHMPVKR